MPKEDPEMDKDTTTGGTTDSADQRPAKVEEIWLALGPFSRLGKGILWTLVALGGLTMLTVVYGVLTGVWLARLAVEYLRQIQVLLGK